DVSCPTNVVRVQSEFTRSPNGKEHFVLNFLLRVVKMKIERFTFKYPKAPRTMAIYIYIFFIFFW
ncbi:unnamed protein product, partial [Brassica oleracea var. botrytis]